MISDRLPENYSRIAMADRLSGLLAAAFGAVNAVVLPRRLEGDYQGLAQRLAAGPSSLVPLTFGDAVARLTGAEKIAADQIAADLQMASGFSNANWRQLREAGYGSLVELRVIKNYNKPSIHEVHADRRERLMCCYNDPRTEFARNEDIIADYSGPKASFRLAEGAPVFRFGVGHLWRQAGLANEEAPPFFHRAPSVEQGAIPRLVLVADKIRLD